MGKYVKTVYATAIKSASLVGGVYKPLPGTTLKDKFNFNVVTTIGKEPKMKYYMIGGNYDNLVANNTVELKASNHSPTDCVVYNPMPFIVRDVTSDLTGIIRDKYFLRVVVGSKVYYYGKRIDDIDTKPNIISGTTVNGVTSIEKFIVTSTILNPVVTTGVGNDLFNNTLNFSGVSLQATIRLTNDELKEIKAANLDLNPTVPVTVREIGLITGVESVNSGNTQELDMAQTAFFIQSNYILDEYIDIETNNVNVGVELGGIEPHIQRTG